MPAPDDDLLTVKVAAAFLGVGVTRVRELTEEIDPVSGKPFLEIYRPSPGTIWIVTASARQFKNAVRDPEFWPLRKQLNEATPRERQRILANLKPQAARANPPAKTTPTQPTRRTP